VTISIATAIVSIASIVVVACLAGVAARLAAMMVTVVKLKEWARAMKRDVHAIYLAARDPRVPWYVKALALCVAAYALSPIDLIPDFIPVLGYLDDLIIVPLGILAVVQLIPPEIMAEHRATAAIASERPISRSGAVVIVLIWIASIAIIAWLGYRFLRRWKLATMD
jgi:uncharacterized membrane protein YkvA (DUF1232 family)